MGNSQQCVAVRKNPACQPGGKYSNYKDRREIPVLNTTEFQRKMITKITAGLLAVALLAACSTTATTAKRTTLRETNAARLASTDPASVGAEPSAPAEGPEDIPGEGPRDPAKNPALVPSPLLRQNAAGGL